MQQTLTNLQDVPGVIGSFVLNADGALIARVMPAYVPDEVYPDLGRRLSTAFATMDASFGTYEDVLLKFDEHWLFCRRTNQGFLGVVSTPQVNYPALRMASNMAATKLNGINFQAVQAQNAAHAAAQAAAQAAPQYAPQQYAQPAPPPGYPPPPASTYAPPPAGAYPPGYPAQPAPAPAPAPPQGAPAAPPKQKRYWRGVPIDD